MKKWIEGLNIFSPLRRQDAKCGFISWKTEIRKTRLFKFDGMNKFENQNVFLASWCLGGGYLLFVFFFMVLFGLPVWAGDASQKLSVDDISKKVEEAQTSAMDVQMGLHEEVKDSLSGMQQVYEGEIKIKSPDKVYVHYKKPNEQFLYVGGNLMQMYQPDQKMVIQQHNGNAKTAPPVFLGVGKELKRYISVSQVTILRNSDSEVGLLLIPRDKMAAGFDRMKVFIHKKDWWPYQMEMETPSMINKTTFNNFSFNKGLSDSLFQFTPPKGTQIEEGVVF
jgi:outer membrane lipoprotein carrier protein